MQISETLEFEQNLIGLASISEARSVRKECLGTFERFVSHLLPDDERKAERFEALCMLPGMGPDLEIPVQSSYPALSGMKTLTQRCFEFAIAQYLASNCSQAWTRCVMRLSLEPRYAKALQRPLLFTKAHLLGEPQSPSGIHYEQIPAYATQFLQVESANFNEPQKASIHTLCRALEMRMLPEAKANSMAFVELNAADKIRNRIEALRMIER